jgi:hypothetical protein
LQIVFNKEKEEKIALKIADIGEKIFGIKPNIRYTNQNIIAIRFENEIIGNWFYNEFGEKCNGKFISNKYLGDIDIALGLLDADSCIDTHGRLKIVLKNKKLLIWLKDTLYLNGINTGKIKKIEKYENTYILEISSYIIKGRLSKLLNKTYYDKRMGLTEIRDLFKNYIQITSIDIEENVKTKIYNLSVEGNHTYIINGIVVHNCYVISSPNDNIESIFDTAKKLARTYSYNGGCGIDISKLRPKGFKVNNAAKHTSGAISFMDLYNTTTALIGQAGRRGALMISIADNHPDIEEFIELKSDLNKVTKANISIRISNNFMDAVLHDKIFNLEFICEDTNEKVEKKINAKKLFRKIAEIN